MKPIPAILTPLVLLVGITSARAAAPSYDRYQSWLVACDNTLSCEARGFDERHPGGPALHITHAAGPDASLGITLYAGFRFRLDDLTADGIPLRLQPDDWTINSGADFTTLAARHPNATRALIARLHDAGRIGFRGSKGSIPLDGMSIALSRMDERQGRTDGVTALIRTGPATEDHVQPAPPLPVVATHPVEATLSKEEAERLIASTRGATQAIVTEQKCTADATASPEPAAYPLDARQALVFVPCGNGSYRNASLALIVSRQSNGPVRLFQPDLPAATMTYTPAGSAIMIGADFNPQEGVLTMLSPAPEGGYCGSSARWGWDGSRFHLAEVASQKSCGGIAPLDWPLLFRSTEQRE